MLNIKRKPTCPECKGIGKVLCTQCTATGGKPFSGVIVYRNRFVINFFKVVCPGCQGMAQLKCTNCNGVGKLPAV